MREVVMALDVGGTRTKIAFQDRDGETVARDTVATVRHPDPARTVTGVIESISHALADAPPDVTVRGIGLAVPGYVDEELGIGHSSGNLGWKDVPFVELIHAATGLPAVLNQDLRAGGRAEAASGAAVGGRSILFVPIGTGIGAALILDGAVWTGAHMRAGELGHLAVEVPGEVCACGRSGCLETVASAGALRRRYRAATGQDLEAAEIAARVATDEPAAVAVWNEAIGALARALDWADTLLDFDVIVIGGGLSLSGDLLLAPLRDEYRRLTGRVVPIRQAVHGDWAGAVGTALRTWERIA